MIPIHFQGVLEFRRAHGLTHGLLSTKYWTFVKYWIMSPEGSLTKPLGVASVHFPEVQAFSNLPVLDAAMALDDANIKLHNKELWFRTTPRPEARLELSIGTSFRCFFREMDWMMGQKSLSKVQLGPVRPTDGVSRPRSREEPHKKKPGNPPLASLIKKNWANHSEETRQITFKARQGS